MKKRKVGSAMYVTCGEVSLKLHIKDGKALDFCKLALKHYEGSGEALRLDPDFFYLDERGCRYTEESATFTVPVHLVLDECGFVDDE